MRITCPHCGSRDLIEFTCQGDAGRTRHDPALEDQEAWNEYVYQRSNPRGWHREFWQHHGGCRAHLIVERSTETHEIRSVKYARKGGAS
jgi:methylglutamate dehydrogenase subunit B